MISGDSGEYEFLTEAVELSRDVKGMCCEIGLRRGLGTKTIIDAVRQYCPNKRVISIDPYGSIEYIGREHTGKIRLDYTNQMRNETVAEIYSLLGDVNWQFFNMTDREFFELHSTGVEWNDIETGYETLYSTVHFDGPHTVEDVLGETRFFHERTVSGATLVYDDITPDFYDHSQVHEWLLANGYAHIKTGYKKAIYRKI